MFAIALSAVICFGISSLIVYFIYPFRIVLTHPTNSLFPMGMLFKEIISVFGFLFLCWLVCNDPFVFLLLRKARGKPAYWYPLQSLIEAEIYAQLTLNEQTHLGRVIMKKRLPYFIFFIACSAVAVLLPDYFNYLFVPSAIVCVLAVLRLCENSR